MSTELYATGKENLGLGNVNMLLDDMIIILVNDTYVPDFENDDTQSSILESAVIAERSLTGVSFDKAVFDADDVTFPSLSGDTDVAGFVIAKNTGELSTTLLLYYCDNAPEFPVTLDGTDFTIVFDNSTNKIFKL